MNNSCANRAIPNGFNYTSTIPGSVTVNDGLLKTEKFLIGINDFFEISIISFAAVLIKRFCLFPNYEYAVNVCPTN